MKRYSKTPVTVDKSGIRAYTTTYYPPVPISDTDRFVYVREGDRVDTLAYKYYKDPTLWWIIAKANEIRGKAALKIGTIVRIPSNIADTIDRFRNLNENP